MSQGTLYFKDFPRGILPKALINFYKLDVNIVDASKHEAEFEKLFPEKTIPSLVGPNKEILHESIAVNYYLAKLIKDKNVQDELLGSTLIQQAEIMKWISFTTGDVFGAFAAVFYMYNKRYPYHQDVADRGFHSLHTQASILERVLEKQPYLVGNTFSLADYFSAIPWVFMTQTLFGKDFREKYPHLAKWIVKVISTPLLKEFFPEYKPAETPMNPPK